MRPVAACSRANSRERVRGKEGLLAQTRLSVTQIRQTEFRGGRDTRDRDSERPGRWSSERSERHDRPHFSKDHSESKDRRDYAPRREREKQPDPDSPFAKLAALKAQLEANAKERR